MNCRSFEPSWYEQRIELSFFPLLCCGQQGVPFPDAEQNAIDAVMQYAIYGLGFQPDNIILFAWSIGGYSASWAAMNYPDVKHVVSECLVMQNWLCGIG